jgi:hypothetical protein
MSVHEMLTAIDDLSPEQIKQVYTYIQERHIQFVPIASPEPLKPRVLGLHASAGKAWMSEDFTAELPDEFWFGET